MKRGPIIQRGFIAAVIFYVVHLIVKWAFTLEFDFVDSLIAAVVFFAVFYFVLSSMVQDSK